MQSCNRAAGCCCCSLHGGAWKVGGVPVLFLGIHGTGRRGAAAVPFMVGRGRWAGCRCCFWASMAQGGGVLLLFPSWWGVEGGRGAGAVPEHPWQQGGGVLLFLHGGGVEGGRGAGAVPGHPWQQGGRGCCCSFMVGRGRWATDHPRSSNVSRTIFRSLCPHTKYSFSFLFVSSGEKRFKMYHFDRCKSPRTPLFKGV